MKVRDLVKLLNENCKPDDIVMLQSDPEGNSYGHLGAIFPAGDSGGFEVTGQDKDFDVKIDDCVILMPYTTVRDW